MDPTPVEGCPDVYVVDCRLRGMPGILSAYVVDAERPTVVDTGTADSVDAILDALGALDIDPEEVAHVVPTHVHLDHAGGTGGLAAACENATVWTHPRGRPYLTDAEKLSRLVESVDRALGEERPFGEPSLVPAGRCRTLADGDVLDLGDRELRALETPGHAPHHLALLDSENRTLLAGDAVGIFVGGEVVPTTPPPNFDLETNLETIERLRGLDIGTILYGHFGPGEDASTELEAYADLLPRWVKAVAEAKEEHGADVDAITDALGSEWPSPTLARDVAGVLGYLERADPVSSRSRS